MLSKLKHLLFYSNFFVSFCSACYFAYFCLLSNADTTVIFSLSTIVFCLTFVTYNFHRIIEVTFNHNTGNERLKWTESNLRTLLIISFIILLTSIYFLFRVQFSKTYLVLLIPAAIVLLYNLPFSWNLRSISRLKIYLILFCWMLALVYFPVSYFGQLKAFRQISITIHQSLFFIIILILFDIKGLTEDAPGLKTIPMLIEKKHLKKILFALLALFSLISLIKLYLIHDTKMCITEQVLSIYLLFLIIKTNYRQNEMFYLFWVESTTLIQPLAFVILDKFMF